MLGGAVTPASVQDRDQIASLLKEVRRLFPFLERAISDSSYQGAATAAAASATTSSRALEMATRREVGAFGSIIL